MRNQNGNFLLQALLALALIVALIPFFAQRLATREKDSAMYAATTQIETAQTAARIYLRENLNSINYDVTKISGDKFADTLEPFGLPLGFIPRTIFGQEISLITEKNDVEILAYLELDGGNLSELRRAELVRRIGFYASTLNDKIYVIVPLDENFSDSVRRLDKNPDDHAFLSDLNMGGFGVENINAALSRNAEFGTMQSGTISVFGTEDGRKIRSKIDKLAAVKTVFQNVDGQSALTISRGTLTAGRASARTISKYGDSANLTAADASIYDFSMTAGRTSFTGPSKWDVRGNVISDNITFSTEQLEVASFINATRGQDVYINSDTLDYATRSGIDVGIIRAANITLVDQTSDSILRGGTGATVLDIRVGGTSTLPDVLSDAINNDAFIIISDPRDPSGKTTNCRSIINGLDGTYNAKSLSQNIICHYVFWQRLEKRIDIKKCLLDGKSDCT